MTVDAEIGIDSPTPVLIARVYHTQAHSASAVLIAITDPSAILPIEEIDVLDAFTIGKKDLRADEDAEDTEGWEMRYSPAMSRGILRQWLSRAKLQDALLDQGYVDKDQDIENVADISDAFTAKPVEIQIASTEESAPL